MTYKDIKKLATYSYTKEKLDEEKINKIVKNLSRNQLKLYIKALKSLEKEKTLLVYLPKLNKNNSLEADFKKSFPNKKILFKEDDKLIAGVRIVDKDDVYDLNLQNTLKNLISYVAN